MPIYRCPHHSADVKPIYYRPDSKSFIRVPGYLVCIQPSGIVHFMKEPKNRWNSFAEDIPA